MAISEDDYDDLVGGTPPADVQRLTANELRSFIERIERIELEVTAARDDQKEVYAEAKARGYDVPTMRRIVALRKKAADDIAEQEAIEELYRDALDLPPMGGLSK